MFYRLVTDDNETGLSDLLRLHVRLSPAPRGTVVGPVSSAAGRFSVFVHKRTWNSAGSREACAVDIILPMGMCPPCSP